MKCPMKAKRKKKNLFLECFISNEQIIYFKGMNQMFVYPEENEKKRKQTNAI